MHGLRCAVLPSGLPSRKYHSGLERSRLSRSLEGSAPAPACNQQLSRIHWTHLPCAMRRLVRAGNQFRTSANVGVNVSVGELKHDFDAILLAGGATAPRDLPVPGRELDGIYFAMQYLTLQNKRCEGDSIADSKFISAKDKNVVIIGGGDTGADCLGTVHRQGARSVVQFELLPKPPAERAAENPWPNWPNIFRTSSAHEEGGGREYAVLTKSFTGNGRVQKLNGVHEVCESKNMKEVP